MKSLQILLFTIITACAVPISAQVPTFGIHENGETSSNGITPLNGNGSLGNIYNVSKCGLNYVQASQKVTSRNSTGGAGSGLPCTLNISGLPATCIVIEQAYLWYEESYNIAPNNSSPANPNITVTNPATNVFNYVGTAAGMAGEKCWGEDGTRTFRIDVTNAISGNGNYVINTTSSANEIDGMTLFIIYSDYTSNFQGSLIINDGIITTNAGAFMASTITGFTACANSTSGKAFAIMGDCQYAGGAPNQSHESILNNSPSTVFNDMFWNYDQLNTSVSAGQTSANFGVTPGQTVILGVTVDCISWLVEGLYYQTTTCTTCPVPLTLNMNNTPGCGCNSSATVTPAGVPGPYTYSWAPSGGNAATATNLCPGTYTVTVTAAGGCVTNTATVTITSNPVPIANATNTGPYCAGSTIQLNSVGGTPTDDWTGPGGYVQNNVQNPTIPGSTPAMSGVYTVTVTNAFGCTATATTSVTVNPNPTPVAANTGPYCQGATIQLNSVGGFPTDDWTGPGGYTSTNTQNPTIINSTPAMSGVYTVTSTNAAGCTATSTTTVTVNPSPLATANNTGPYCEGATISLSSSGGTGYSWTGPSGFSSGVQNPTIPAATVAMGGVYTVVVTGTGGCTASATTTVVVNSAGSATANNTGPYCEGATILLSSGAGAIDYDWTGPGGYTSTNTQNPSIPGSTVAMSGVYTVTVTMPGGCTSTATTTVVVNALPVATASNTGPYCAGETIQLNSSGGTGYSWTGPLGYSNGTQNPTIPSSTTGMSGVYTVVVTNAAGCTSSATTTVNVSGGLVVAAGSNSPVCEGQSLDLTSTLVAGGTYLWSGPGGYSSGVQNPSINPATLANTGTYTVTITNPSGCSGTATVSATINAQPVPNASNTGPYCEGATIQLNSSGGGTYSWSGPSGYSNGTQNPTIASSTIAMNGIYTVTVTNAAGCSATATTNVVVNPNPTPTATNTGPYCIGATIQLNSPSGSATDDWAGPGGYTATNVQNPTIPGATLAMSGVYTVTVTNAANCSATATTTVTVNTTAPATANNSGPYCEGSTINLSSGNGSVDYDWTGPGGYVQNNTQNPSITNSTVAMSGVYTVTVTDAGGCTGTATTSVTVNSLPTPIANNTGPYCAGTTIQLNSAGGNTYSWSGPLGYSNGTQNPSIASSTTAMSGVYTVTATNAAGCSATATTTVVVNASPTPTATNTGPYCIGATIQLNSVGGSATDDWAGPGGYTATDVQNPTIPGATLAMNGVYTVTVTNASNCSATATTTVTVNTNAVATANNSGPFCEGSAINLSSSNGAIDYDWTGPGGYVQNNTQNPSIPGSTIAMSGVYTVTITNAGGCTGTATTTVVVNSLPTPTASNTGPYCPGTSIQLNSPSGNSSDDWTGPAGYSANDIQNPTILNSTSGMSGMYTVTVTDANGCSATATTNVLVHPAPNAIANSNSPICETGTINLNASGGVNYDWTGPNGFTATSNQNPSIINATTANGGVYTVTVTDANGCTATATTNVVVNTNLVFNAGSNSPVCIGNPINLNAELIPGATYDWNGPNGYIVNNQQNPVINPASAAAAGTYTVTATSGTGCSGTATVDVTVNNLPIPGFVGDVLMGCAPLCVNLTDQSTPAAAPIVTWSWNVESQNVSAAQNPNYCFDTPGLYDASLTVTDANGCSASITQIDYINVVPDPVANFTYTPGEILPSNPTVTFNNNSTGGTTYSWDFGDGTTSTDENPMHTYTTVDSFCVVLTVTNSSGCSDVTQACLHYVPDFSFYIPNSFTPNQDELNPIFTVYGAGVRDLDVRIFDRWGREIYQFDDMAEGWNGTTEDGKECQIGVYTYRVEVYDVAGHWHEYMGHVNLIR